MTAWTRHKHPPHLFDSRFSSDACYYSYSHLSPTAVSNDSCSSYLFSFLSWFGYFICFIFGHPGLFHSARVPECVLLKAPWENDFSPRARASLIRIPRVEEVARRTSPRKRKWARERLFRDFPWETSSFIRKFWNCQRVPSSRFVSAELSAEFSYSQFSSAWFDFQCLIFLQ